VGPNPEAVVARFTRDLEEGELMGIGVSLILIAVGLVLLFATTVATIGWILLIVGIVGIVLSMVFWSTWGGFGGARGGRRTTVIEE
jgi:uncharacterized RDD family membrane protein YckC